MAKISKPQQKHIDKANALEDKASRQIDVNKSNISEAAGMTIREINIERQKAGLIKGPIRNQK